MGVGTCQLPPPLPTLNSTQTTYIYAERVCINAPTTTHGSTPARLLLSESLHNFTIGSGRLIFISNTVVAETARLIPLHRKSTGNGSLVVKKKKGRRLQQQFGSYLQVPPTDLLQGDPFQGKREDTHKDRQISRVNCRKLDITSTLLSSASTRVPVSRLSFFYTSLSIHTWRSLKFPASSFRHSRSSEVYNPVHQPKISLTIPITFCTFGVSSICMSCC